MNWKQVGRKLLCPPVWVMLFMVLFSAVSLTCVFLKGLETAVVSYFIYVLAFYTLTVVCIFLARVLPGKRRAMKEKINSTPLGNRYMTDRAFRAKISLHISLAVNLLYVGMNLLSWHQNRSWWFIVLAVYYVILSTMRFLLVRYVRKNTIGSNRLKELRLSVACSAVLLTLNFFLAGAVLMIVYQDKGHDYHGVMIYVMALYTFYQTTHAIIDIIRYRKLGSPVMSTAKAVSLASALVSMLNLETAMFAQFGADMAKSDQRLMIILTGAGVSIAVIAMAVTMIVRSTRGIKEIRSNENG